MKAHVEPDDSLVLGGTCCHPTHSRYPDLAALFTAHASLDPRRRHAEALARKWNERKARVEGPAKSVLAKASEDHVVEYVDDGWMADQPLPPSRTSEIVPVRMLQQRRVLCLASDAEVVGNGLVTLTADRAHQAGADNQKRPASASPLRGWPRDRGVAHARYLYHAAHGAAQPAADAAARRSVRAESEAEAVGVEHDAITRDDERERKENRLAVGVAVPRRHSAGSRAVLTVAATNPGKCFRRRLNPELPASRDVQPQLASPIAQGPVCLLHDADGRMRFFLPAVGRVCRAFRRDGRYCRLPSAPRDNERGQRIEVQGGQHTSFAE
jgi:hypothetical protein